jgi:tRNA pseudouridine13 synthase
MDIDVPDELSSNDKKKHLTVKVKTLTEADLANYSIFDIILPLPGFDVSYPGGEFGE